MSAYALPGFFPPLENTLTFANKPAAEKKQQHEDGKEEKVESEPKQQQEPYSVVVSDAKLDPMRLIELVKKHAKHATAALTPAFCSSSTRRKRNNRKQLQRRESDPFPATTETTTSVPTSRSSSAPNLLSNTIPQEAAVDFVLDISFCGRRYSASRSLSRIRQLRMDLIRENSDCSGSCCCIPDVPAVDSSTERLGFARLQDALRSCYRPALHKWFQSILKLFPTPYSSPSLSDFLYESEDNLSYFESRFLNRSCPAKLDSIEESDSEIDFEDDEDDSQQQQRRRQERGTLVEGRRSFVF